MVCRSVGAGIALMTSIDITTPVASSSRRFTNTTLDPEQDWSNTTRRLRGHLTWRYNIDRYLVIAFDYNALLKSPCLCGERDAALPARSSAASACT